MYVKTQGMLLAFGLAAMPLAGAQAQDRYASPRRDGSYLGRLSTNRVNPDSISNRHGRYGSQYGNTINNPRSSFGARNGAESWRNPYTTDAPRIYGADGKYLGKLSTNRYDPESISNPNGKYGSRYGNNLMNPYSKYGSQYSSESWRNPHATRASVLYRSPRFGTSASRRFDGR